MDSWWHHQHEVHWPSFNFWSYFLFGSFSVHKPKVLLMVDGVCFYLKPLFLFQTSAYLFGAFKCLMLVFVTLTPLQHIHLNFFRTPRPHASMDLQGLMLLPFNMPRWIFFNFDSKAFSVVVLLSLLGKRFSHEVFPFLSLMRGYFILGYLRRPHCQDPILSFVSSLHFAYGGC